MTRGKRHPRAGHGVPAHRAGSGAGRRPIRRRVEIALLGVALLTAAALPLGPLRPPAAGEHLDIGLETAAALIAAGVAVVFVLRCSQTRARSDALIALAFGLMATTTVLFAVGPMIGGPSGRGLASIALLAGWLLCAATLLSAGRTNTGEPGGVRRTVVTLLVLLAGALGTLTLVASLIASTLPETAAGGAVDGGRPLVRALHIATGLLFGAAAVAFACRAERADDSLVSWLAIAAVLMAVLGIDDALVPSPDAGAVGGDLVRIALTGVLAIAFASGVADHRRRATREAVSEERRRLGRELHDGVAQELAYIALRAARLDDGPDRDATAGQVARAAERALEESRAAITALAQPYDGSLHSTLRHAAGPLADRAGAELTVIVPDDVRVTPDVAETLGRIVREATSNAVRHGRAEHVHIEVRDRPSLRLRIRDDGRGFDPAGVRDDNAFGLINMRERAEALGAAFRVTSAPGRGTEIEVAA